MTGTIHVVIADDEAIQIDNMKKLLQETANNLSLELIIDSYNSGEAFLFAMEDKPEWQLAFLDIEMHALNGMDVARKVREHELPLEVVFVTAYAEYAIEGYEVAALDYLLKPVSSKQLEEVFRRYLARQPKEQEAELLIQSGHEWVRYKAHDIMYVESQGRALDFYLLNGEHHSYAYRLKDFVELAGEGFVQPHRSYCVNLEHVQQILKTDILMVNGEHIPLSRRLTQEVQKAFIDYYKKRAFYYE